ncbi:MAG: RNA polymerase sigma factor [Anaerolineae bacterium]
MTTAEDRTNEQWLNHLNGTPDPAALGDLRERLIRGLRYAIKQRYDISESDIEDFVQEAIVKILDNLDTFRGESKFTTWAQKIAIRVAFSELRRKRWENISLQDLIPQQSAGEAGETTPLVWIPSAEPSPERRVTRQNLRALLVYLIQEELTDLQRQAMVAVVLQGMPVEVVARRMDTNRNALYKLLHDARQRLKHRLEQQGVSVDEVMAVFAPE